MVQTTSCRPVCPSVSTFPTSAGTRRSVASAPRRQCAVKQYTDENDKRGRLVMSCMTPATDNTWISIEDEEAKQFRASVVRMADDQPPARLPGVRGRRSLPPAGHDGDDRPQRAPVPLHQAHPPEPGTRPVHRPRDEPLHRLLPLRALLQATTPAAPTSASTAPTTTSTSDGSRTACWKASSPATSPRSAPPACSPTRPT